MAKTFEGKKYFNSNLEVFVNKFGYFYIACANQSVKNITTNIFDDIFLVLPHNMTELVDKRRPFKQLVEEFRLKRVYPKVNSLINYMDYSIKCRKNKQKLQNKPNILFLGLDSVSLVNFKRIFPATYNYLNNLEDNLIFERMNSAGTSTIDNIVQMFTGLNRKELNSKLDKKIDDTFVDFLPFIWEEFERNGYLTFYQEDLPKYGIFNYLRKGFRYFPTNIYTLGFWKQYYKIRSHNNLKCHRNRPSYSYWLENIELFIEKMNMDSNKKTPYFSFNWLTEYTHDNIDVDPGLDVALKSFLSRLMSEGHLNNTIVFFLSDHGNKLTTYSSTENGKRERILPLLSIRLPRTVVSNLHYENFNENKNKLVSFLDVYQTLKNLLFLSQYDLKEEDKFCQNLFKNNSINNRPLRGTSLLEKIPPNRLCSEIHISDSFCSCFKAFNLNESQFIVETKNSFNSVGVKTLDYIKNITKPISSKCIPYVIDSIGDFKKIHYSEKKIIYSGQILLNPGNALFQINLKLNSNQVLSFNDLPIRLSKYGNQSSCVYERDLQNFCYCR